MRIPNFCYIQVIVFVHSYLPVAAVGTSPLPWINWEKYKNYNLNVTEVLDSDFKNAFPGIFNFTVGILILILDRRSAWQNLVWLQYIGSRWQSIPEMAQKSAYYLRSISFWQFSILWMLSLVLVFLVLHMPVSLNLGPESDLTLNNILKQFLVKSLGIVLYIAMLMVVAGLAFYAITLLLDMCELTGFKVRSY